MFEGIFVIFLGLITVPSLILKHRPDAESLFEKIKPFKGIIGIIGACWGVIGILKYGIFHIGGLFRHPITWTNSVSVYFLMLVLGFMLGYALIKTFLASNPEAKEKANLVQQKLAAYETVLGIVAICVGIWRIVWFFV